MKKASLESQEGKYRELLASPLVKEEDMHRFFVKNPNFLPLLWPYDNVVFSKFRLGNQHVVDFAFARADSPGVSWNFIEIKRPNDKKTTKAGNPTKELTHGLTQASNYLNWFKNHIHSGSEDFPFKSEANKIGIAEPKSHLVIGRKPLDYEIYRSFLGVGNYHSIEVMSFDRSLKHYRSPAIDYSLPIKVCTLEKGKIKVISEISLTRPELVEIS